MHGVDDAALGPPTASPSTVIASAPVTSRAGSVTVSPPTVTRPSAIIASARAARRDAGVGEVLGEAHRGEATV